MYVNDLLEHDMSIIRDVRNRILECLDDLNIVTDDVLLEGIDEEIKRLESDNYLPLRKKISIRRAVFNSFRKMDILQELIEDKEITEIMVNGKNNIFVERAGKTIKIERCFFSDEQLEDLIQQIVSRVNRAVNVSSPIVDARLEDGSRVHIVLPPISLIGPVITIRKFPEIINMNKLVELNAISTEAAEYLGILVRAGYNIFISGGTNSGKTTFLNALSGFILEDERVITIEDSAELQLEHIKNIVKLETRNANSQGEGIISIAELIRASLRMNPSRIIVGEVRGKEAFDMLQAMNTGHDGSISTGHANSPKDMLYRLEMMVLSNVELPLSAIRSQISGAIDIIVHLGRLRDKSRKVLSIIEVGEYIDGIIQTNTLFEFFETGYDGDKVDGVLLKQNKIQNITKLNMAGYKL